MNNPWNAEILQMTGCAAIGAGVGTTLGLPGIGLSVGLLGYITINLRKQRLLSRWLQSQDPDSNDEPPESTGVLGDIADQLYHWQQGQQQKQQHLIDTIEHVQDSFSSLKDAVVMLDERGNIDWCNQSAQRMLGLRHKQDKGFPIANLLRDPGFLKYFEQGAYDEPFNLDSPVNPDTHLQVHITLFGEGHHLLFARDVTQVKKLEQMRHDFIANVSHEMRTPLTVISGYLEMVADYNDSLNPRWIKAFEQMHTQTRRMENLVRDLIQLTKLETIANTEQYEMVEIHPILVSLKEEALAASNKPVEVILDCPAQATILGYSNELYSAFSNLVINAVRYSGDGQLTIRITWRTDPTGAYLSVKDNGIGIDEADIPRLTERFYRVDKSRSIHTGGTGLGLAIVKHILARHQANLQIDSQYSQGSTFTCHFDSSMLPEELPKIAVSQ